MDAGGRSNFASSILDNVVVRLVVYYVVAASLFVALEEAFPWIVEYLDIERGRQVPSANPLIASESEFALPGEPGIDSIFRLERSVPVAMSMLGALALALPVAWVYTWTRPTNQMRQQVAQALVVLPIAIALVVFLVKGSLALAFSLAGIVAAVRFRAKLSDASDAVFLFVVIGIGLAAGVQLLSVAFLASLFFNAVTLAIQQRNFAHNPSRLVGWRLRKGVVEDRTSSDEFMPTNPSDYTDQSGS